MSAGDEVETVLRYKYGWCRAAWCVLVRWTCWNIIFLLVCIQGHNVQPFWHEGAHDCPPESCPCMWGTDANLVERCMHCTRRSQTTLAPAAFSQPFRKHRHLFGAADERVSNASAAAPAAKGADAQLAGKSQIWRSTLHAHDSMPHTRNSGPAKLSWLRSMHKGQFSGAVIDAPWSYHAPKLIIWCGAQGPCMRP